jgi:hypothetical protein
VILDLFSRFVGGCAENAVDAGENASNAAASTTLSGATHGRLPMIKVQHDTRDR